MVCENVNKMKFKSSLSHSRGLARKSALSTSSSSLRISGAVNLRLDAYSCKVVIKISLFTDLAFSVKFILYDCGLDSLFLSLFDKSLHPVVIVTDRLDVEVFEFLSNITPDLSILEEGVELE